MLKMFNAFFNDCVHIIIKKYEIWLNFILNESCAWKIVLSLHCLTNLPSLSNNAVIVQVNCDNFIVFYFQIDVSDWPQGVTFCADPLKKCFLEHSILNILTTVDLKLALLKRLGTNNAVRL